MTPSSVTDEWPALPYEEWAATKKTLHMYAQMLGKLRLAIEPPQPEWLNVSLQLENGPQRSAGIGARMIAEHHGRDGSVRRPDRGIL